MALTIPVLFAAMAHDLFGALGAGAAAEPLAQLALITPVMFYTGWPIHRTGWLALSHRRRDMNSLITLAHGSRLRVQPGRHRHTGPAAGGCGRCFEAVGMILTLILLGRLIETQADGTGQAIRKLLGLQARTARIVPVRHRNRGNPVDELAGDELVIRPGEKIPVNAAVAVVSR